MHMQAECCLVVQHVAGCGCAGALGEQVHLDWTVSVLSFQTVCWGREGELQRASQANVSSASSSSVHLLETSLQQSMQTSIH